MKRKIQSAGLLFIQFSILLVAVFAALPALAGMEAQFLYQLSDFTGTIPMSGGKITIDNERVETYVVYGEVVRVFDRNGMETYSFSDIDTDFGNVMDIAVLPEGDLITLAYNYKKYNYEIMRRDYRGEPTAEITLKGLPSNLSFKPSYMTYSGGSLYFADPESWQIVVTDVNGLYRRNYDVLPLLELEAKNLDRGTVLMTGFNVDRGGNMLFTASVLFRAFVLSPEGKLKEFGEAGSLPGKFNIVSGITSDKRGNFLVTDRLKGAVQVFDKDFNFQYIFGDWDGKPGTLRVPSTIAVDDKDKIFVANGASKGVSVYRLLYQ
jgi:DNA-binding beta-propeller fold protein YncE